MSQVFISYRRADDLGAIGRIHDWLAQPEKLGPDGVFMDVEDIPMGADFRKHIAHQMNQADVVLAMIGPKWLETIPARADDPTDVVRIELEMAFDRHLYVVPILLGREVKMPAESVLPPTISHFSFLNAETIDPAGRDFAPHMDRFLRGLEKLREARENPRDFRNRHQIALIGVRRGRFVMGAGPETDPDAQPNEGPEREVEIHHGFWMGKYPVTVEEYGRVMGREKLDEVLARIPVDQDHRYAHHRQPQKPITQIDSDEAVAFCERLTEFEEAEAVITPPGYVYRLPTEAEWEYCCRAGTERQPRYSELEKIAWTVDSEGRFANVGELQPNARGFHDLLGLIHEWCQGLVVRGGSYHEPAFHARASARIEVVPNRRSCRVGMRVALGPAR